MPKKALILGLLVLIAYIIFLRISEGWQKYYPGFEVAKESSPSSLPSATPSATPGVATPSSQTMVDPRKVAEKLDFSRKLINTETKNLAKLEIEIKNSGGVIVNQQGSTVVVDLPDDKTNEITQNIETKGLAKNIETDYPSFLTAESIDWGVQKVEAEAVWPLNKGEGVKIAVVDTGLDYNHPDLKDNYVGGYDYANKDDDPFDDHGHGTHVSGTIASSLNQSGLVGVAPKAKILAVKALTSEGLGYISDLISSLNYAVSQGAQVINLSLGTTYDSALLKQAVDEAVNKGVIVVAAAGNNSGGPLLYPAAYSSVISVAATDNSDRLASFSALGAELSAPGVSITSTVPGGGLASWSGTSMAAPHVSAAAAMLVSAKVTNIRERLRETSTDLGESGRDTSFGYGLINLKTAFNNPDTTAPLITILSPENNNTVAGTVLIKIEAKDENGVTNVELLLDKTTKLESWTNPPYEYSWDYSSLTGEHELLAKASDPSHNVGMAKITINIQKVNPPFPTNQLVPTVPPSPTEKPNLTPTPSATSSASPFPTPDKEKEATPSGKYGRSFEVRRDLGNENASEHRQNFENIKDQESSTSAGEQIKEKPINGERKIMRDYPPSNLVPEITNFGKRSRRVEEDKKVKGLKTYRPSF